MHVYFSAPEIFIPDAFQRIRKTARKWSRFMAPVSGACDMGLTVTAQHSDTINLVTVFFPPASTSGQQSSSLRPTLRGSARTAVGLFLLLV